ncbi:hypothetical protein AAII07_22660 [Microvirga sp. 0TCS3.31]
MDIEKLHKEAFGLPADNTMSNRGPGGALVNAQAMGKTPSGNSLIVYSPGRLEIGFTPNPPSNLVPGAFEPQISDVNGSLSALIESAGRVSQFSGNALRIALVVQLSKPTADFAEANLIMEQALPVGIKLLPSDLDFQFQLNRRTSLQSYPDIQINRLLRFSVDTVQLFNMPLGPFQPVGMMQNEVVQLHYSPTILMDWNTVPTGRVFDPQTQMVVLKDLRHHLDQVRLGSGAFQ